HISSRRRSPRILPSFPTRRSSDLSVAGAACRKCRLAPDSRKAELARLARPDIAERGASGGRADASPPAVRRGPAVAGDGPLALRSEEHTSELQSQSNLVCRLLLEK